MFTRTHRGVCAAHRTSSMSHARDAAARGERARLTARHLLHRTHFLPLLRAWRDHGIEVVLMKGFVLADRLYDDPADRPYADIDVLVRESDTDVACAIATHLGWNALWIRRESLYADNDEEAVLAAHGIVIEVHRFVVDSPGRRHALARRLTSAAWESARRIEWHGLDPLVLDPLDSALFGILLARAWSEGDGHRTKPSDARDLAKLCQHAGMQRHALLHRARRLGVLRSALTVLGRCDPWGDTCDTRLPSWLRVQWWRIAMAPERGHLGLERTIIRLRRLPGTIADAARHVATVWHVARTLARHRDDVGAAAADLAVQHPHDRCPKTTRSIADKERLVRSIKLVSRLISPTSDPCLVRSVALWLVAPPEMGIVLHSGKAASGHRHAWVTSSTVLLRDLEQVSLCARAVVADTVRSLGRVPPSCS